MDALILISIFAVAVALWLTLRKMRRENEEAHTNIGKNIDRTREGLEEKIAESEGRLSGKIDSLETKLGGWINQTNNRITGLEQ